SDADFVGRCHTDSTASRIRRQICLPQISPLKAATVFDMLGFRNPFPFTDIQARPSMSKHEEHHHHQGHHNPELQSPKKYRIHHDWRFWVAVVLMLAAMFAYVASGDLAFRPGGKVGPPVPAAE